MSNIPFQSQVITQTLTQILPEKTVFTSQETPYKNSFFAYYKHSPCDLPEHAVPFHTLEIIDKNCSFPCQRRLGDHKSSKLMKGGEILFYPATINHQVRWEKKCDFTLIFLHPHLFEQEFDCHPSKLFPFINLNNFDIQHLVHKLKQDILAGCPLGSIYGDTYSLALILEIIKQLKLTQKLPEDDEEDFSTRIINKIQEIIQMRVELGQDVSLQEMAKVAGMSQRRFSKLFYNTTGISFLAYYNIQRIKQAKKLLKNSDHTINFIAQFCGFEPNYFSRYFRKVVGLTPRAFRQEFKSLWFD